MNCERVIIRKVAIIAEVLCVIGAVLLYIWALRPSWPYSWVAILAMIGASAYWRRETPAAVGLTLRHSRAGARWIVLSLTAIAGVCLAIGALSGTIRNASAAAVAGVLAVYCLWGLFQQYVLNGYLTRRLTGIFGEQRRVCTAVMAGGVFALVHLPNPFLMMVTFVAGFTAAWLYSRYRNLVMLGVAHGVLGSLIWLAAPDPVTHHLYVGPNCVRYCQASGHVHSTGSLGALLDPSAYDPR